MSAQTTTGSRDAQSNGGPVPGPRRGVNDALPPEEASISDLLLRLIDDLALLFRQEVELAKTELRRELSVAMKAGVLLAAGALLALTALLLFAWAAAWGLAVVLPTGVAFLIVGLVVAAGAAALAMSGRKRLQDVDLTPQATIESLQRDKQAITERRPV